MNWDTLLAIFGSGGLAAIASWLVNLKVTRRRSVLEKDDVSRLMAERDNETILNLYNENRNILEKLASLESMLYKLVACKHYDTCPARCELQEYKANIRYQRNRQPRVAKKGHRHPRDHPGFGGDPDHPDGQPPEPPQRGTI